MIKLIKKGVYDLDESKNMVKILTLDDQRYVWPFAEGIGQILVTSQRKRRLSDSHLATGNYRIYDVRKEPNLTDLRHLELSVGNGWQGYLLLTGLPSKTKRRSRIIATDEVITSGRAGPQNGT